MIVTDTEGAWRIADVIWVDGRARNPKVPTLFQVADVDTGVINWVNADLVTQIVPRCGGIVPIQGCWQARDIGKLTPSAESRDFCRSSGEVLLLSCQGFLR